MPFYRYAVPALSLAAGAAAQCSVSATTTIADAGPISGCPTFTGSVALSTGSTAVDFGSTLQQITGDLIAVSTNTTSMTGAALQSITGTLRVNAALSLSSITFPRLSSIGTVDCANVPALGTLTFATGVQHIDNFQVRDSQIQDLSSIDLKSANTIYIADNNRLSQLNWQTEQVTGDLTLDSNGQPNGQGFSAHFPNLKSCGDISINQVDSLDFSSLANASGIQIYRTTVSNLSFPNLTTVGNIGVFLYNDESLTNISFPRLQTIAGGLAVTGNAEITGDIRFPRLQTAQNVNVTGAFSGLEFPAIDTIFGKVTVITSNTNFDCGPINGLNPTATTAEVVCSPGSKDPSTSSVSGSGSGTGSGSGGSTTSSGAASRVYLGPASIFGATGLFAAMLGMM